MTRARTKARVTTGWAVMAGARGSRSFRILTGELTGVYLVYPTHAAASLSTTRRLARVEIREVKPKRKRKGGK